MAIGRPKISQISNVGPIRRSVKGVVCRPVLVGTVFTPTRKLHFWALHTRSFLLILILAWVQKSHKPVRAGKITSFIGSRIWATMEIYVNSVHPIATVPCLHQSNLHIKRKLWEWRVQKYNPCAGVKIPQVCTGRESNRFNGTPYMGDNGNSRKFVAPYSPRYRVCTKPISISKGSCGDGKFKTIIFAGVQMSHKPVQAGKVTRAPYRHGTVFAPK